MRIHHLALRTRKLARLVRFYRETFDLNVFYTRPGSAWLAAGSVILMIERAEQSEPTPSPKSMELIAFAISRARHLELRKRLARRIEGETAFTSYFRDPDGRRVAVSHFKPASKKPRATSRRM